MIVMLYSSPSKQNANQNAHCSQWDECPLSAAKLNNKLLMRFYTKKIQKGFVKYKLKPVFVIATFTACSFCESLCHNLLSFEINFNRFKSLTSATWGPRILLDYITIVLKISTRIKINEYWQQAHSAIQSSSNTQPVCNIKLLSKFLQQSP